MIVTRFAPSPTGYLHIGGLRTALYSYLWAKKSGGKFLLRIEDTDLKRNSKDAANAIEEAFKWVGLSHDEEIYYQSNRFDIYKKYVQQLLDEGKAYYCYMSPEEKEELYEKQKANKERTKYDGRYRDFDGTPPEGIEPVIRIKAPLSGEISFTDGIKGEVKFNVEDILDDFVIARADGSPLYNFVVAIDDALMGVSEVIRGDDHLSNTPKQMIVYEALGFDIPKFYHVPMILNPSGKKLSKRDGAMDVMEYKKLGYLPEALLNFLIRLGWSHGDQEIFSMEEMLELFNPNDINKSASAYNAEKLQWINTQYIKSLSADRLVEVLKEYDLDLSGFDKKEALIDSLRDRAKDMNDLAEQANSIVNEPVEYDQKACDKFIKEDTLDILSKFNEGLKKVGGLTSSEEFNAVAKEFMSSNDLKLKDLAPAIRIAVVGSASSPAVFEVLSIVGYENVIKRIEKINNEEKIVSKNIKVTKEESLEYHISGKIGIKVTKPCDTARDLSMAYTPGVAYPCREISDNPELAYKYTNKDNLVAVITDSTAVLGLGDIGAVAGKPVMEGKSVLFKAFANIDAFDIELDEKDTDKIIDICRAMAPTFGGINLEDIKAPKCFEIEERLQEIVDIPVMHDDQHGTAMITTAGIINALEISGKDVESMKIVVAGAGAAGIACAKMYRDLGAKNIVMLDSKGVIHSGREDLNKYKAQFAQDTEDRTLADAMKGADMFLGLSAPGIVDKDMVASMNPNPIIFALSNPVPEVLPEVVAEVRDDVMMGTGRSDYPNQVNNVLGFPFIFRGALDVRATKVTEGMKMAAAKALAALAKEPVPRYVKDAYDVEDLSFGNDYIIPKPFDRRVLPWVATAVAKAAIEDGVARVDDSFNIDAYRSKLEAIIDAELKGK